MTDDIYEEDYNSRLSKYLGRRGKSGVFSDIAVTYFLVATAVVLLGQPVSGISPSIIWLSGFALYAVARATKRVEAPRLTLTKNGRRVEIVRDERDGSAYNRPECDEHGCDSNSGKHVRCYEAFYILGYEISRRMTEDRDYCDEHYAEHYPMDGLAADSATAEVVSPEEEEAELITD